MFDFSYGEERLIPLEEIEEIYVTHNCRMIKFEVPEEFKDSVGLPPSPYIDVMDEMKKLESKPSNVMVDTDKKGSNAILNNLNDANPNEYEFNAFRELILLCIIETKKRIVESNKTSDIPKSIYD